MPESFIQEYTSKQNRWGIIAQKSVRMHRGNVSVCGYDGVLLKEQACSLGKSTKEFLNELEKSKLNDDKLLEYSRM